MMAPSLYSHTVLSLIHIYTTLMEKLVEKTGNKYKVYFSNSGAEANEGAMKLAKYATQRPVIISMKNAFHGRTMATATITTSNACLLYTSRS